MKLIEIGDSKVRMTDRHKEGYHHTAKIELLEGDWPDENELARAMGGEPYCGGISCYPKLGPETTRACVTIWGCN